MLSTRLGLRVTPRLNTLAKRNFQTSFRSMSAGWEGTPASGVYSNLPFKVKGRKYVPFKVAYWGVLGFFFAFPFLTTYWHLYKSGSLRQQ
ncbi:COX8 [[Candida] subhashii]|uniref:Cytochrome c oxidase subunit 8, mitochondrial n=1 Tax=[Candida] subhashii TaxID=561895 RepID=A0A8J5QX84_9ASCO|nr:COX8 [[Candida] subhashii]KAG7663940.1 COX8 [[Candida] subhashii]